jgi:hypothetical protein
MSSVRDLVIGTALFVLLVFAAAAPSWSAAQVQVAGAAPAAAPARVGPITSGPGFTVCAADEGWRRSAAETAAYREVEAAAVLYDGRSASGLSPCWTEQPQVVLFGYEALAYDAQDPNVALLKVRPASGYRVVILTGPVRGTIAVVGDRKLDELVVPWSLVTPAR